MSCLLPETAARERLVIMVTATEPAGWERLVVQRLQASGTCRVVERTLGAMNDLNEANCTAEQAKALQAGGPVTAIVDLTGRLDTGWSRGVVMIGIVQWLESRLAPWARHDR